MKALHIIKYNEHSYITLTFSPYLPVKAKAKIMSKSGKASEELLLSLSTACHEAKAHVSVFIMLPSPCCHGNRHPDPGLLPITCSYEVEEMGLWLGCWLSLYMSKVSVLFNVSIWLTHYQIRPHMGRFYMDAHIRLTGILLVTTNMHCIKMHKMKRKEKINR